MVWGDQEVMDWLHRCLQQHLSGIANTREAAYLADMTHMWGGVTCLSPWRSYRRPPCEVPRLDVLFNVLGNHCLFGFVRVCVMAGLSSGETAQKRSPQQHSRHSDLQCHLCELFAHPPRGLGVSGIHTRHPTMLIVCLDPEIPLPASTRWRRLLQAHHLSTIGCFNRLLVFKTVNEHLPEPEPTQTHTLSVKRR